MYGLSDTEDIAFLVDRELQQVRIGRNEVRLCFDSYVSINLSTDVIHRPPGGAAVRYEEMPSLAPLLASLLGAAVRRAWSKPPGTLCLEFATGDTLEIEDTSERYESYQIQHADRLIVV